MMIMVVTDVKDGNLLLFESLTSHETMVLVVIFSSSFVLLALVIILDIADRNRLLKGCKLESQDISINGGI